MKLFVSLMKNDKTPIKMIDTRAISFPAVKMSWTFIESFVDMQLIAVRRHKQIAARILTISCGVSQLGKKGFAAYSANVSATIACNLMDENHVILAFQLIIRVNCKLLRPVSSFSEYSDMTT